jgi:glycolate oxidase iron-sulfur subunit
MTTALPVPGQNPAYEDFARCVHCGICLNACPTYRLWNLEADSPRGRIHQMIHVAQTDLDNIGSGHPDLQSGSASSVPSAGSSVSTSVSTPTNGKGTTEGAIGIGPKNPRPASPQITKSFVEHIDKCLDCRACETACPSAVEYGKLVEHARALIERDYKRPLLTRIARNLAFRKLLPHSDRIATVARLIWLYQRTGLQRFIRFTGMLELFGVADREQLLPAIETPFFFKELGRTYPAVGPKRARVAFFAGCVAQVAFARLNDATIRVLTANGVEVVVPKNQMCCGALAAHAGIRDSARDLARKNLLAFAPSGDVNNEEFDAIVTNAAGCGSTLKEYDHLFTEKEAEFAKAAAFKSKVRDVTEFLASLGLTSPLRPLKPLYLRVTYQDSCHLLHGQKVRNAPRDLLKQIPGLDLVELPHSDICCGSAGVYNVTQTKASLELLDDKMKNIATVKPEVIVTANPGCMLQLRAGVQRVNSKQEVMHVVELLDRSMRAKAL